MTPDWELTTEYCPTAALKPLVLATEPRTVHAPDAAADYQFRSRSASIFQ